MIQNQFKQNNNVNKELKTCCFMSFCRTFRHFDRLSGVQLNDKRLYICRKRFSPCPVFALEARKPKGGIGCWFFFLQILGSYGANENKQQSFYHFFRYTKIKF
jgi:hypothetical protein